MKRTKQYFSDKKNVDYININNTDQMKNIINDLKIVYEDYWKNFNEINTSIKLPIYIKIKSFDSLKVSNFEETLDKTNLIYDFFILKFDKDFIYYQVTFNGTRDNFLKLMRDKNFNFNTQNKTWILE